MPFEPKAKVDPKKLPAKAPAKPAKKKTRGNISKLLRERMG